MCGMVTVPVSSKKVSLQEMGCIGSDEARYPAILKRPTALYSLLLRWGVGSIICQNGLIHTILHSFQIASMLPHIPSQVNSAVASKQINNAEEKIRGDAQRACGCSFGKVALSAKKNWKRKEGLSRDTSRRYLCWRSRRCNPEAGLSSTVPRNQISVH